MFDKIFIPTCDCSYRVASNAGLFFDGFVVLATVVLLIILAKTHKRFLYHYFAVMVGVSIFEVFTSPLWNNPHFGSYAYYYRDVSWVLTLGWTTLILSVMLLVDTLFKKATEVKKFFLYLLGMSLFGFLAESTVVFLGLRTYSDEVLNTLWGPRVWSVPVEAFYYIPLFSALIIGFYKYWVQVIEKIALVPEKKIKWTRSLFISVITVFMFELMVEPMVINTNLPEWSYVYKDISIIMTGVWVLMIWLSVKLVDKYFLHLDLKKRFGLYVLVGSVLAIPLEYWYMGNGFRVYGDSAMRDFIGYTVPMTNLPLEILFAMPMYFALMMAFIRYWEFILDKRQ